MKRRTRLLLIDLALLALAIIAIDQLFVLHPGVTEKNVQRIREGMVECVPPFTRGVIGHEIGLVLG